MIMESKKLGPAGLLAMGKQPDPSWGSLRCLDLVLLNSWYVSRLLFGSSLLLLEFTQFRKVCWTNPRLSLNQLKKWSVLYPSKTLLFAQYAFSEIYLFTQDDFHFPLISAFGVRISRVCLLPFCLQQILIQHSLPCICDYLKYYI